MIEAWDDSISKSSCKSLAWTNYLGSLSGEKETTVK
jgi:hypothetical protein